MSTEPEQITIRLDDGGSLIAGEVQVSGGARTRFTGWIGLLALLEQAIEHATGTRTATAPSTTQSRGKK